jgi:Leucine-rich repeat (LRR) protein
MEKTYKSLVITEENSYLLEQLDNYLDLEELHCDGLNLENLNISMLENLQILDCSHNKLSELIVDNLPNLRYLDCSHNELSCLYLDNNVNLSYLDCSYNQVSKLNLRNLSLHTVNCAHNCLSKLYINDEVDELDCSYNNLQYVPILAHQLTSLKIDISNNPISAQLHKLIHFPKFMHIYDVSILLFLWSIAILTLFLKLVDA